MTQSTIDSEEQGDSKSPQLGEQPEQVKSLTEVMASLELPWPKDVFGEVPKGEWHEIDKFAKTRGYRIDTISGDLMRHGWKCYERLLRERVNDLVSYGVEVTTDPSNPQKVAQEANKAEQLMGEAIIARHRQANGQWEKTESFILTYQAQKAEDPHNIFKRLIAEESSNEAL